MRSGTAEPDAAAAGLRAAHRVCDGGVGSRRPRASVAPAGSVGVRSAGRVLPRRNSAADWERFITLAPVSRSAAELLTVVLHRPIRAEPVDNRVFEVGRTRRLVRVVQHRLVDSRAPHQALGLSATALVGARLPDCIRPAARKGSDPLCELLDRAGAFWTSETLGLEQLPGEAAGWSGRSPVVRLTRRLFVLGTPVADVVEDIPFPEPPAVRGPPAPRTVLRRNSPAASAATEPPPAAGSG